MALSFLPDPIPSAVRGKIFEETISVVVPGSILEISAVLQDASENIDVIYLGSSITLKGAYQGGWSDVFTFVEKDQSDKTAPPQTAVGISNMPEDKNLYDLDQDQKQMIPRTWVVTVKYEDTETLSEVTETGEFVQEVFNDLDAMKDFMGNYYK